MAIICRLICITLMPFSSVISQTNIFEPLRVYAVKSACFEYMFTSAMERSEGRQTLSFNHINGRTVFAGVGEAVGEYTLMSYDPGVEMEFNPTTDSYVQRKAGTATLRSVDGRKILLDMGKILPLPGWVACLVWLDCGNWMYVSETDVILAGNAEFPIECIKEDSLVVITGTSDADRQVIPLIADDEKSSLLAMWESRRKAREEDEMLANKKSLPEDQEQKPVVTQVIRHAPPLPVWEQPERRFVVIKTPPQFFYGTEFRYPVAFETVPLIEKTSYGTRVKRAIVVPKLFQTGFSGHGIKSFPCGGTQITVPR
ncbi:MAG: hypothetical protein A2283_19580 [Lentisphaerae bacterium RIFOXYA12_FULL_48_11]|nr:MAG: hypothetical protein A2283_19580 [Lentisphaerae bacterium RIFOXYA12_FULL_48_11]